MVLFCLKKFNKILQVTQFQLQIIKIQIDKEFLVVSSEVFGKEVG
jgi:hypothetical protein